MTARIYEFPQPNSDIEKNGGCLFRLPMPPEDPPPPLPGTGFVRLV
jgi:hypothetical protein